MSRTIQPLTGYTRRVLDDELDQLLAQLPAISLEGPKGTGKTSTARQRCRTYIELDRTETLEVMRADATRLVTGAEPIVIDEWQRFPSSWDEVRHAVNENPSPGRFILTGSASPGIAAHPLGCGAHRPRSYATIDAQERGVGIPTVSLAALLSGSKPNIAGSTDVTLEDYVTELLVGGFPGMRIPIGRAQRAALDSYLERIIDRDFAEAAGQQVRNPRTLYRWLAAYAAATGTTSTYETIRDAATSGQGEKPAKSTTIPYRDTLEHLWIVEPVPAWAPTSNHLSRLSGSPKHHLADPALAARLLGVSEHALLDGQSAGPPVPRHGTLLGALFESLVTLSVRVYAQAAEGEVHHLRRHNGDHEIDFIVVRPDQRVLALEVKLAQTVGDRDVRHLHWLAKEIGPQLLDAAVITTGSDAYRRADGIAVIPAALVGM